MTRTSSGVTAALALIPAVCWRCGHPQSDHDASADGCVYGWYDWQALDAAEAAAEPCECEWYQERPATVDVS